MQVLGCVKEIHEYELMIGLPNGLFGSVAITDICQAYTQLLQRLASEDSAATVDPEVGRWSVVPKSF